MVRVKSTKVGARSIVRPVALSERQRTSQGIKWIIEASHSKPGMEMQKRLAKEMIAVVRGDSAALNKKETVHKGAMIARYVVRVLFTKLILKVRLVALYHLGKRVQTCLFSL